MDLLHPRPPLGTPEPRRYLGIKQLPEWNKKVEYRTRTELMQARKAEQIPDMSYDLDGDGVVDQRDYFYGHGERDRAHIYYSSEQVQKTG